MSARIFLAGPAPAPPSSVPVADFPGLEGIRWEAWDGSTWDLLTPSSGAFLVPGVRGLTTPPATRHTSESPAVAGTRDLGDHVGEREVFWPVYLYSDEGSQAWIERDRAFWRGLRRGRFGWWVVTHPDGTERRLRCRFLNDGGHTYAVDPTRRGWALYGITLVAPQPYWEGAPIVRSWDNGDPVEFFQEDGLHIAPGSRMGNARIPNPGDVEAWLRYTVHGPSTSASVGVDGDLVEVPFVVDASKWVVIDTHPTRQTAIEIDAAPPRPEGEPPMTAADIEQWITDHLPLGVDRTGELGATDFAPVAADTTADLDLNLVGAGMVTASLIPLYERAW